MNLPFYFLERPLRMGALEVLSTLTPLKKHTLSS